MKRLFLSVFMVLICVSLAFAQPVAEAPQASTFEFTDSSNRTVELSGDLAKVAPSGAVATMFLAAVGPEYMCNVNSSLSDNQAKYLNPGLLNLPATGQLYGSKSTLNLEELIALGSQVIIDMGDYKDGIAEDLDKLQAQVGIPCIFLEANLEHMASAIRQLGELLPQKKERAESIASFIDETLSMAEANRARIKDSEVVSVMYTQGPDGLGTNPQGSSQAQVIELVGARNAVVLSSFSSKGGGNPINMEQVYNFNPDCVIFSEGSIYETVESDPAWSALDADYYLIPCSPYNWMSNPPSLNMVLGIWWLGNLLYPQYYDYDMVQVSQKIFKLFWDYDLSDEEAYQMLSGSTLKD